MQCPSCQFENLPGLSACGRCGTRLDLAGLAIDVHPPRASATAKRLRTWIPQRGAYATRDAARILRDRTRATILDDLRVPIPGPEVRLRLLVPGLAHLYLGQVARGRAFLGAYLTLLVCGLIGWGTVAGSLLLGLAFSVHATSALNVVLQDARVRFPSLLATTALVSLALVLFVYVPGGWALTHLADYRVIRYSVPPFEPDDILVFNRWAFLLRSPRPGDVVLFEGTTPRTSTGEGWGPIVYVVEENELIDRVLAGSGDQVVWSNGRLTINGTASRWTPLNAEKLPAHLELVVPEDCLMILPTASRATNSGTSPEQWQALGCVRAASILGRVYLRNQPLGRFWFIR